MESAAEASGLKITRVPLDSLLLDPANARAHGDENLIAVADSLRRFGQAEPLVVRASDRLVIGGNGRLIAMRKLGWTECDVVLLDVSDIESAALGIALNRTAELADWDNAALGKLFEQLREEDALSGVGFSPTDIDELLAQLGAVEAVEVEDPGPDEPPTNPVSQPGDLWILGEHRLLCGDATKQSDLNKLLDGQVADLVWTDPPYGVSYEGKTADALTIKNDGADELRPLLEAALGNASRACRPGAVWYVAAPAGPQFLEFAAVLSSLGIWRQTLVWVKDAFVLGHSDFHYRHEAIFYGWAPGKHRGPEGRTHDTVWGVDRPRRNADHPTSKPVELVTRAVELSSAPGELVLDPFLGSGTVLIAAEQTGRRCCAMELDPRYVDVAIRRWESATGKKARLEQTGTTLEVIAHERGSG